jgi:hypothetical protein
LGCTRLSQNARNRKVLRDWLTSVFRWQPLPIAEADQDLSPARQAAMAKHMGQKEAAGIRRTGLYDGVIQADAGWGVLPMRDGNIGLHKKLELDHVLAGDPPYRL